MTTRLLELRDARARRLPLLPLARDIARRRQHRLVVSTKPLPVDKIGGLTWWHPSGDIVIMIDPPASARMGYDVDEVFAHELGHVLDPRPRPRSMDRSRGATIRHNRQERFANTIGPLLLEERPTSYDAAWPLVLSVIAATKRGRGASASS